MVMFAQTVGRVAEDVDPYNIIVYHCLPNYPINYNLKSHDQPHQAKCT